MSEHPTTTAPSPDSWAAGYDMGLRHGYELATVELLRMSSERMAAGADIVPLLSLVGELRERAASALAARGGAR